jgi:hypothetical protein
VTQQTEEDHIENKKISDVLPSKVSIEVGADKVPLTDRIDLGNDRSRAVKTNVIESEIETLVQNNEVYSEILSRQLP